VQRRDDAHERSALLLPTESQQRLEMEVVEELHAHRVDREHVHRKPHPCHHTRRGVVVAVAAKQGNPALGFAGAVGLCVLRHSNRSAVRDDLLITSRKVVRVEPHCNDSVCSSTGRSFR
jgi:hypothetical protein